MGGNGFKLLAPIHRIVRFYEQVNISKKGKISTCKKQFDINKRLSCTLPASKCVINLKASILRTATRRKPLWVPQGSSAIRKFKLNSVMIQKKKLILSRTQENVDIMTSRLTWDIFITKDAFWDGMLPLLLVLSKCELEAWNKFISWTFLYLETFL